MRYLYGFVRIGISILGLAAGVFRDAGRYWFWVLAIALLGGCRTIPMVPEPIKGWNCTSVDPYAQQLPANPCFRALLSEENLITLQWQVANTRERVYIYDDVGPDFDDIGLQPVKCDEALRGVCETSFRVTKGGHYRWVLSSVGRRQNHPIHVPAEIDIPSPYPPAEITGDGFADVLGPVARRLTWSADTRNAWPKWDMAKAWVEVKDRGSDWNGRRSPRTGPGAVFDVPAAQLARQGLYFYSLRDCHLPAGSQTKFCSDEATAGFHVASDRFIGQNPRYVKSGENLQVEFTGDSGDVRILTSDTLLSGSEDIPFVATTGTRLTIDAQHLTPGTHSITLASCTSKSDICSNRLEAAQVELAGTVLKKPPGLYAKGAVIASVTPHDGTALQWITAPYNGFVRFYAEKTVHDVEAGDRVAYMVNIPSKPLTVKVDSPVDWILDRAYTDDFQTGRAFAVRGGGGPLALTYGAEGGIWLINEFSTSIEHITADREVKSFSVPLARVRNKRTGLDEIVSPFSGRLGGLLGKATPMTALAERAVLIGQRVWFTQGGGSLWGAVISRANRSRVISFDLSGEDLPSTLYDDRFCVYNVPADDPDAFGDNQIIGLAAARGRIWIGESRGFWNSQPSAISSFIPERESCENLLNFADPGALSKQRLPYCGPNRNPQQDACLEKTLLNVPKKGLKVAHLAADPVDESIWFTNFRGNTLGNLNPDRAEPARYYALPERHIEPFYDSIFSFRGYPWSLEVDEDAVYVGEFLTQHILRFDKATGTFDEIEIPNSIDHGTLHSLDIDRASNRLWFTLGSASRVPLSDARSTIGYIDLASWRDSLAKSTSGKQIAGVVYSGLEKVKVGGPNSAQSHGFTGIAIHPKTGNVAVASMFRREVIELMPHGAFRP